MNPRRWILALLPALALAGGAEAQSIRELQYLEDPRTHAIVNVPAAPEPVADRRIHVDECSPENDLTGTGRLLAMRLGDMVQKAGVRVDEVLASPRCDAVAAARLLELVPVKTAEFLAPDPPGEMTAEEQRDEVLLHLALLRPSQTVLLMTHGRNIEALTGRETVPGEMQIVSVSSVGEVEVRFSIAP